MCRSNPWKFLTRWVITEDAHNTEKPFQRFPDKEHLYYLTQTWLRHDRLLVPKSRQLTVTWTMGALCLWEALFFPSRLTFIQSKKESDSDEILNRINTIYNKLPRFIRDFQPLVGGSKTYCRMRFKYNRSQLLAIPEGPDHVRGFTATGIFVDEIAFQADVELLLAAIGPSLGKTGWFTGVSSAAPSYFQLMVFDKV